MGYDSPGSRGSAWQWAGLFSPAKVGPTVCRRADGLTRCDQDTASDVYIDARLDAYSDHYAYPNQHTYSDRHAHASADRHAHTDAAYRYTRPNGDLYPGTAYGDLYSGAAYPRTPAQLSLQRGVAEQS